MEPGAAADVEQVAAVPGRHGPHRRLDQAGTVERVVLDLVDGRVLPDVRAAHRPGDKAREP